MQKSKIKIEELRLLAGSFALRNCRLILHFNIVILHFDLYILHLYTLGVQIYCDIISGLKDMFSDPVKIIAQLGIQHGQTVVDLGAGTGHYSFAASPFVGSSGHIYAVDIQIDMLRKLKTEAIHRNLNNIEIMIANLDMANSTKLREGSADWVLLCNVLFMLKDKSLVLNEAKRILKPTGHLLIVDWKESFGGMGPQPEYVVTEEISKQMASQSGFQLVKNITAGDHHYGLIFKK
jgi:ubiquinone/menaquinone biosynthesis C-methylase UbiE